MRAAPRCDRAHPKHPVKNAADTAAQGPAQQAAGSRENGGNVPGRCGRFYRQPRVVSAAAARSAFGSSGRSVIRHAPPGKEGNWAPASSPPSSRRGGCIYRAVGKAWSRKERSARWLTAAIFVTGAGRGWGGVRGDGGFAPAGLKVHATGLLGSVAEARTPSRKTMAAALARARGFTEESAVLRTWLDKIATSRCLNARRAASARTARERGRVLSSNRPLPTPPRRARLACSVSDAFLEGAVVGMPPGRRPATSRGRKPSRWPSDAMQMLPARRRRPHLRESSDSGPSEVAGKAGGDRRVGQNSALRGPRASWKRSGSRQPRHQPHAAAGRPPRTRRGQFRPPARGCRLTPARCGPLLTDESHSRCRRSHSATRAATS